MNYLFFSDVLVDMDCCWCVHSAFRLKAVGARTQGLERHNKPAYIAEEKIK